MHRIFGITENGKYTDREGAYLIPVKNNQIGIVKTPKGYFFFGMENGESHTVYILQQDIFIQSKPIMRGSCF